MGFFNFIADAARSSNEDAHGHRLLAGVQSTFLLIPKLDDRTRERLVLGYAQIVGRLGGQSHQWSSEQKITLGRTMQDQAREKFDVDISGSYAKWMAGSWLESGERGGVKAREAHRLLTDLVASMLD